MICVSIIQGIDQLHSWVAVCRSMWMVALPKWMRAKSFSWWINPTNNRLGESPQIAVGKRILAPSLPERLGFTEESSFFKKVKQQENVS